MALSYNTTDYIGLELPEQLTAMQGGSERAHAWTDSDLRTRRDPVRTIRSPLSP